MFPLKWSRLSIFLFRQGDYKHGFSVMKEETNKEKKVVQPGKNTS